MVYFFVFIPFFEKLRTFSFRTIKYFR
jgi:hypothetical protein